MCLGIHGQMSYVNGPAARRRHAVVLARPHSRSLIDTLSTFGAIDDRFGTAAPTLR